MHIVGNLDFKELLMDNIADGGFSQAFLFAVTMACHPRQEVSHKALAALAELIEIDPADAKTMFKLGLACYEIQGQSTLVGRHMEQTYSNDWTEIGRILCVRSHDANPEAIGEYCIGWLNQLAAIPTLSKMPQTRRSAILAGFLPQIIDRAPRLALYAEQQLARYLERRRI